VRLPPITSTFLTSFLVLASAASAGPSPTRARSADRLAGRATTELARGTIEGRQLAIRDLEEATLLDPARADIQLKLARTYMACGFLGLARHRFEKVQSYSPGDAASCFGLGQVWRYDWLKYLDLTSRDRAIMWFGNSARLNPGSSDAWLMLVPLMVERGDLRSAATAAQRALEADPNRPDALLADAYTSYRLGQITHADSMFSRAVPRLPRAIRARFEDIAPVASKRDTLALRQLWAHQRPAFTQRFWREQDPDLSTPENEAQLEYWSRVAHAYLMFYDARRQEWDERGEMLVRYGTPARQVYNGIGEDRHNPFDMSLNLPINVLVWDYPDLGMRVVMQDRLLNGFYTPEIDYSLEQGSGWIDAMPDPDLLARRSDVFGTADGRGVFPTLPPGARPLPVVEAVARFEGDRQPRLLGHLEAQASPGDSLTGFWVVRDSNQVEVARASRRLSPSACTPTESQVADFAQELPPGRYSVGFSVRGAGNRKGAIRQELLLAPVRQALALSDLLVSCGVPDASTLEGPSPAVRIEPNPGARVASGDPLTAYFEIYHLAEGEEGLSHFEFEYTVKSTDRDSRVWMQRLFAPRPTPPTIHTEREEQQVGSLRRQFVSVPVQGLPPGNFKLEIHVRDLVAGTEATSSVHFWHEAAPPAAN
jgi:GWxTD domain-containing protein